MNFWQLPLSLNSLFSFTVFISLNLSVLFFCSHFWFSWHHITGTHFCHFQCRPYPPQTFLPSSSSCHLYFPSPSVSLPLPGPQTVAAALHSNENREKQRHPKQGPSALIALILTPFYHLLFPPQYLSKSSSQFPPNAYTIVTHTPNAPSNSFLLSSPLMILPYVSPEQWLFTFFHLEKKGSFLQYFAAIFQKSSGTVLVDEPINYHSNTRSDRLQKSLCHANDSLPIEPSATMLCVLMTECKWTIQSTVLKTVKWLCWCEGSWIVLS